MQFSAVYVKSDHSTARVAHIDADDLDAAASIAIDRCPADEFVASVSQTDLRGTAIGGVIL